MQVKIDTSERFHVITIQERVVSANMTEELINKLSAPLKEEVKNLVLNLKEVVSMDLSVIQAIVDLQRLFHEQKASFVSCCLAPAIKQEISPTALWELLNLVPTESEASDIVQMEEIERELDAE